MHASVLLAIGVEADDFVCRKDPRRGSRLLGRGDFYPAQNAIEAENERDPLSGLGKLIERLLHFLRDPEPLADDQHEAHINR